MPLTRAWSKLTRFSRVHLPLFSDLLTGAETDLDKWGRFITLLCVHSKLFDFKVLIVAVYCGRKSFGLFAFWCLTRLQSCLFVNNPDIIFQRKEAGYSMQSESGNVTVEDEASVGGGGVSGMGMNAVQRQCDGISGGHKNKHHPGSSTWSFATFHSKKEKGSVRHTWPCAVEGDFVPLEALEIRWMLSLFGITRTLTQVAVFGMRIRTTLTRPLLANLEVHSQFTPLPLTRCPQLPQCSSERRSSSPLPLPAPPCFLLIELRYQSLHRPWRWLLAP